MAEPARCDEVRDLLPELAAGVAAGDDRARALAHLAGCASCRRELEELTAVLDGLTMLAPEAEPSPGFENAVLAAMTPGQRPDQLSVQRRRRRRAVVLAAAAAVLAVAVAAGVQWERTFGRPDVVAADVTAATSTAGRVYAYPGDPSWLFLDLESAPVSGQYLVRVVTNDDETVDVGWCRVRAGQGSWGWAVDVPAGELRELQLVRDGDVAMSASFE